MTSLYGFGKSKRQKVHSESNSVYGALESVLIYCILYYLCPFRLEESNEEVDKEGLHRNGRGRARE